MIQRLRALQEEYFSSLKPKEENGSASRPFANLGDPSTPEKSAEGQKPNQGSTYIKYFMSFLQKLPFFLEEVAKENGVSSRFLLSPPRFNDVPSPSATPPSTPGKPFDAEAGVLPLQDTPIPKTSCLRVTPARVVGTRHSSEGLFGFGRSLPSTSHTVNECSNSSWAEMESFVIGSFQMYPPTLITKQILILRYLTPVGEYMEVNCFLNYLKQVFSCIFSTSAMPMSTMLWNWL